MAGPKSPADAEIQHGRASDLATVQVAEAALANRLVLIRCVVAAETYRYTAQSPEWAWEAA